MYSDILIALHKYKQLKTKKDPGVSRTPDHLE